MKTMHNKYFFLKKIEYLVKNFDFIKIILKIYNKMVILKNKNKSTHPVRIIECNVDNDEKDIQKFKRRLKSLEKRIVLDTKKEWNIKAHKEKKNIVIDKKKNKNENGGYKKQHIRATLKRLVWNKWIGEDIGKAKCLCCKITDITQLSFHGGHVIPESKGGETILSNLKPICQNCNSSMNNTHMDKFMRLFD
jgi:hypothetical protein